MSATARSGSAAFGSAPRLPSRRNRRRPAATAPPRPRATASARRDAGRAARLAARLRARGLRARPSDRPSSDSAGRDPSAGSEEWSFPDPAGSTRRSRVGGFGSSLRIRSGSRADESPRERPLAGRHLVEHGAEAEDVGARVELPSLRLLGRHVRGRADHDAALRSAARRRSSPSDDGSAGSSSLASPKSRILTRPSSRDHDVRGLQVAMEDAGAVRRGQGVGDLDGIAQRLGEPHARRGNQLGRASCRRRTPSR